MDRQPGQPPPGGHKTYVFVDEYNRHKRLKVMRACDGCRKRKIRCDGALQNGPWPCGACVRLKLKCVPPTLDADDDELQLSDGHPQSAPTTAQPSQFTFHSISADSAAQPLMETPQSTIPQPWPLTVPQHANPVPVGPTSAPALSQDQNSMGYSAHLLSQQQYPSPPRQPQRPLDSGLNAYSPDSDLFASTPPSAHSQAHHLAMPTLLRTETGVSTNSTGDPEEVDATVRELSEQMGDLSIQLTTVAPYITRESQTLADTPAVEEPDVELPYADSGVSIPPEMMPLEDRAMDYFGYYFNYVHPYIPVLHREKFYDQWRNDRQAISPLILDGIFACVSHYLEEPIEVRRWLALAARHEESFKDVPRLSTVQGLIILAKAREAVPTRRGYYYRSWMQLKYIVTMAIDLGLHQHTQSHQPPDSCPYTRPECMVRTRIWQTLLILEVFVGSSQGRQDFSVDVDSVDFELPSPSPDISDFEYQTTRRLAYNCQVFRAAKRSHNSLLKLVKVNKEWPLDREFTHHNEAIASTLNRFPLDMQIEYDGPDAPPLLRGKHYVAYVHIYQQLLLIMHHRPQLQTLLQKRDPSFQKSMAICNEAAISICRLQEALYRDFGLHGLQFMVRGIGFTIYCILTCTMLHLATITAPDVATNRRARMFFTRHMRMLEHCIPSATPEIQVQIGALREAFSQDISKPFELKPDLGRRSSSQEAPDLPHEAMYPNSMNTTPTPNVTSQPTLRRVGSWASYEDAISSRTVSNASDYAQPYDDIPNQPPLPPPAPAYQPMNLHQVTSAPPIGYALEPVSSTEHSSPVWDPSNIFTQWNMAFGQPSAPPMQPQAPTSVPVSAQTPSPSFTSTPQVTSAPQSFYPPPRPMPNNAALKMPPMPQPQPQQMPAVTPIMWQDAFATAYVSGTSRKRYREESVAYGPYDHFPESKG